MADTPAHTDALTKGAGSRIQGQTRAMDQPVTVLESRDVIGADVYGVDLSQPLSPAAFATLETALHTRAVLCVRQQRVTAPQFLAFARRFGEVERTFAWEDKFKRLLLRFERIQQRHYGMKLMAYTLINLRVFCGI